MSLLNRLIEVGFYALGYSLGIVAGVGYALGSTIVDSLKSLTSYLKNKFGNRGKYAIVKDIKKNINEGNVGTYLSLAAYGFNNENIGEETLRVKNPSSDIKNLKKGDVLWLD